MHSDEWAKSQFRQTGNIYFLTTGLKASSVVQNKLQSTGYQYTQKHMVLEMSREVRNVSRPQIGNTIHPIKSGCKSTKTNRNEYIDIRILRDGKVRT